MGSGLRAEGVLAAVFDRLVLVGVRQEATEQKVNPVFAGSVPGDRRWIRISLFVQGAASLRCYFS